MCEHLDYVELQSKESGWGLGKRGWDGEFSTLTMTVPPSKDLTVDMLNEACASVAEDVVGGGDDVLALVSRRFAEWTSALPDTVLPCNTNVWCVSSVCEEDTDGPYHYSKWIDFNTFEAFDCLPSILHEMTEAIEDPKVGLYFRVAFCAAYKIPTYQTMRSDGEMLGMRGMGWLSALATLSAGKDNCAEISIPTVEPVCLNFGLSRGMVAMSGLLPFKLYKHERSFDGKPNTNDIPF